MFFSFPSLQQWIDLLIKDCLPCETNENSRKVIKYAPQLEFAETAEGLNQRFSMYTKLPIHPASKGSCYMFINCHAFTVFVVTKSTPLNHADSAADILLKQSNKIIGPLETLVTEKRTEFFSTLFANVCHFAFKNVRQTLPLFE